MANTSVSRRSFIKGALALPIALAAAVAAPDAQNALAATKPAKVKIASWSAKKRTVTLKWKAISGAAGYQSELYTDKKRSWKQSSADFPNTNVTFEQLSPSTFYCVRVRAYRWVGGNCVYGAWSTLTFVHTKASVGNEKARIRYLKRYLRAETGKSDWYTIKSKAYSNRTFAVIGSDELDRSTWRYLCVTKSGAVYKANSKGKAIERLCK